MAPKGPDLKRFMDKKLVLHLNGKRRVRGIMRGYDQFMNIVIEDAAEIVSASEEVKMPGMVVIRGNSVENFEVLWTE